jgi:hypothetical protein
MRDPRDPLGLRDTPGATSAAVIADLVCRFGALTSDPNVAAVASDVAASLRREPAVAPDALERVTVAFGLSPFERDVLVLSGVPEEHEALAHLARVLHPRGEPFVSFAAVAATLDLDANGRRHLRAALDAGPLRRHRIVTVDGPGPLPERAVRLAPGLWSVLRGHDHWPDGLEPRPTALPPAPGLEAHGLDVALSGGPHVVVVTGTGTRSADELATIVASTAATAGAPIVAMAAEDLTDERQHLFTLHCAARGACPVLVGRPSAPPLPEHRGPVVVCAADAVGVPLDDRPVVLVDLGERSLGESVRMWQALAPELDGAADRLASLLRIDHVRAGRALADARATEDAGGQGVSVGAIVRHARRRAGADLPPAVRLVRATARWDRLVTTPGNHALLASLVDRVRGQARVLHEWGFDTCAARGVRALFSGPPGTGKTLSAHIVAAALDLDLLAVDLSVLVSKWLGETEKHISEVFAAAERSHAVLFFDEADAIFGRRTDGHDEQSRWANLETAHLLACIDEFDGLVVLATNLRGNVDDAFVRRLDVVVEFEEPGPDEREQLWRGHLPARAPVDDDVDLRLLADVYEITGGLIRNAALSAAFQAAARDDAIDQRSLLDAIESEYQKAGRSFPGIPRRNRAGDLRARSVPAGVLAGDRAPNVEAPSPAAVVPGGA